MNFIVCKTVRVPPNRSSVRAKTAGPYLGVGGGGDVGRFSHEFDFCLALDSSELGDLWRKRSPLTDREKIDEQIKVGHRGRRIVVMEYAFSFG